MGSITMNQAPLNKSRDDKFIFVLNLPKALKEINNNTARNNNQVSSSTLEFSVFGTITPSINIESVTVPYAAQSIKVSSHARKPVSDITFDFKVDNEWRNYWVIYKWLDLLNDVKKGTYDADNLFPSRGGQLLDAYSATFSVYGLDEYDNRKIQFDYIGAFPTALKEVNWNYTNGSEIASSVTFSFTRMEAKLI